MSRALPITNNYPPEWPAINAAVCEAAGHRCIRCGHPYRKGEHGSGEWTACDERCTHKAPVANDASGSGRDALYNMFPLYTAGQMVKRGGIVFAQWRILTVHHFDGDKANCVWWNLMALCQRCHLKTQVRVNPQQPYLFEHSEWAKPYVAGFYAKKYRGLDLSRPDTETIMDELLAIERLA